MQQNQMQMGPESVLLEYTGEGSRLYLGAESGLQYRFSGIGGHRVKAVDARDADGLVKDADLRIHVAAVAAKPASPMSDDTLSIPEAATEPEEVHRGPGRPRKFDALAAD